MVIIAAGSMMLISVSGRRFPEAMVSVRFLSFTGFELPTEGETDIEHHAHHSPRHRSRISWKPRAVVLHLNPASLVEQGDAHGWSDASPAQGSLKRSYLSPSDVIYFVVPPFLSQSSASNTMEALVNGPLTDWKLETRIDANDDRYHEHVHGTERWRPLKPLGDGASGDVWQETCVSARGRNIFRAVKRIRRFDGQFSNMLKREIETLIAFSNPDVPEVCDLLPITIRLQLIYK